MFWEHSIWKYLTTRPGVISVLRFSSTPYIKVSLFCKLKLTSEGDISKVSLEKTRQRKVSVIQVQMKNSYSIHFCHLPTNVSISKMLRNALNSCQHSWKHNLVGDNFLPSQKTKQNTNRFFWFCVQDADGK